MDDHRVRITALEAFDLLETQDAPTMDLECERIVGRPNHVKLRARVGVANVLEIALWADQVAPRYELVVPFTKASA